MSKTTSELIEALRLACKAEISISINEHRSNYETPAAHLQWRDIDVTEEELKLIDDDKLYVVQAYPRTPIGFIVVAGHDLDKCLTEVLEAAENY